MNDQQILDQAIAGIRAGLEAACEREKVAGNRGGYVIPDGDELLDCGFVVPSHNFLSRDIQHNALLATVYLRQRQSNPIAMEDKTIHDAAMGNAWLLADITSAFCSRVWIEFETPTTFNLLMNRAS